MKNMFKVLRRIALAITAAGFVAACSGGLGINPYKDVPYGNYFVGNNIPSPDYFKRQDEAVVPHCEKVAEETNPSPGRIAGAYAVNHGVAGFVGGAGGMAADSAIVGAPVTAPIALGSGAYYGVAAGAQGYESGKEAGDQQRFAYTKYCIMSNTGGYRSVAPSERKELEERGRSESLEKAIAADPAPASMEKPPLMP